MSFSLSVLGGGEFLTPLLAAKRKEHSTEESGSPKVCKTSYMLQKLKNF